MKDPEEQEHPTPELERLNFTLEENGPSNGKSFNKNLLPELVVSRRKYNLIEVGCTMIKNQ